MFHASRLLFIMIVDTCKISNNNNSLVISSCYIKVLFRLRLASAFSYGRSILERHQLRLNGWLEARGLRGVWRLEGVAAAIDLRYHKCPYAHHEH